MTILNTASDGFFNVLIALHRTVARDGALDRDQLLGRCKTAPDADDQRLSQTLRRWTQLGLFQEQDNQIALAPEDRDLERLPARCRELLFREDNNQNFWEQKDSGASDFARALAFVLAQDIYTADFETHASVQALEQRQIREVGRRALQNDVRWNGLRFWGDYLGFFWVDHRRHRSSPRALLQYDAAVLAKLAAELRTGDHEASGGASDRIRGVSPSGMIDRRHPWNRRVVPSESGAMRGCAPINGCFLNQRDPAVPNLRP